MTMTGFPGEGYLLYCHVDGTCSLKRDAVDASTHHCADLVAAVHLAHDLKTGEEIHITVYDHNGKLLFRSFG